MGADIGADFGANFVGPVADAVVHDAVPNRSAPVTLKIDTTPSTGIGLMHTARRHALVVLGSRTFPVQKEP